MFSQVSNGVGKEDRNAITHWLHGCFKVKYNYNQVNGMWTVHHTQNSIANTLTWIK